MNRPITSHDVELAIDSQFGTNFAKLHPELVALFFQAFLMADAHQDPLAEGLKAIKEAM